MLLSSFQWIEVNLRETARWDGLTLTVAQVFTGQHVEIAEQRDEVLQCYYDAHPQRFVHGRPKTPAL